jgi:hypothetical protein
MLVIGIGNTNNSLHFHHFTASSAVKCLFHKPLVNVYVYSCFIIVYIYVYFYIFLVHIIIDMQLQLVYKYVDLIDVIVNIKVDNEYREDSC